MTEAENELIKVINERVDHTVTAIRLLRESLGFQQEQIQLLHSSIRALQDMVNTCFEAVINQKDSK
jgi:hypothetical protein